MSTTTIEPRMSGYAEAVIISGPRKGEFIAVPDGESALTPHEERILNATLEELNAVAKRMAENARAARIEAESMLEILRTVGEDI